MRRKHIWFFLLITLFALSFFYIENHFVSPVRTPFFEEKLRAAELSREAMELIKHEMIGRSIPRDSINDPNSTFLVGTKFSEITTSQNPLSDVLTTLNPNFAAAFVSLFRKLKIKKGDIVAINTSASFPALNISLLSTCEVLGIKAIITTDVSSASYGANHPDFTYLDMETLLKDRNIFDNSTTAASIGGEKDNGEGISPNGRKLLLAAIRRNNINLINSGSLAPNIEKRYKTYEDFAANNGKRLAAFIEVGGTITGFGQSIADSLLKPGINLYPETQFLSNYGLLHRMVEERIPIIFLGNMQTLAASLGVSTFHIPGPIPGEDPLFSEERYSVKLAILFLVLLIGLLFAYLRIEIILRKK